MRIMIRKLKSKLFFYLTDLILNKINTNKFEIINHNKSIAKLVNTMAQTSEGTNECLEEGAIPVPVDFYYSVPDIEDL